MPIYTDKTYYCDGCGKQLATEREMKLCEENHEGKKLVKFVIGKYNISELGIFEKDEFSFSLKNWLPLEKKYWKIPFFINDKEYHFVFKYNGGKEGSHLKQELIPIFELSYIDEIKIPNPH